MCSGHVTVTIAGKETSEDAGLAVLPAWQYCSDARSNRPFANDEFAISRNQRLVPNFHARDIGDRIERSGRTIEWNSDISRPRLSGMTYGGALCKQRSWPA